MTKNREERLGKGGGVGDAKKEDYWWWGLEQILVLVSAVMPGLVALSPLDPCGNRPQEKKDKNRVSTYKTVSDMSLQSLVCGDPPRWRVNPLDSP